MAKQKQKMRFNDKEMSLIKSIFADNDSIIVLLRKVFLHADLSEAEIKELGLISDSPEALGLIRKTYAPEIDVNAPLGQLIDLWLTVDTKDMSSEQIVMALYVRKALKELIESGLSRLEKPTEVSDKSVIGYEPYFSDDDIYINFIARNALITHTEFQLHQLSILAGQKEETVEQTQERLKKDSSK